MLILPAIDIRDGKCVRLTQGDFKRELKYSYYPEETAIELEKAGAKFLHVVDLDGARDGVLTNIFTIKRILDNVTIPIEVGGGIRTMNDIENLLEIGVTRVILGSTAVEDPEFVRDAAEKFEDSIVVGIDARDLAAQIGDFGVSTIIYTDIARDGMLGGINVELVAKIAKSSGVDVIASGGVSSIEDILALKTKEKNGVVGAIIGKALYEGVIDFEKALAAAED